MSIPLGASTTIRLMSERASMNRWQSRRGLRRTGWRSTPKSEPHGGYRIACVWPAQVTSAASALSARLAGLLPGTPAYPYQAIHSSIGNISAPDGRLVDPDRNREDRDLLDRLADTVEAALAADPLQAADGRRVAFGPALLSPRMALVFGRPQPGYWALHRAVHAASQPREIDLVTSWGPHLTLTRFGQPAGAEQLDAVLEALEAWTPVTVAPSAVLVGFYTVAPGEFRVEPYRRFELA